MGFHLVVVVAVDCLAWLAWLGSRVYLLRPSAVVCAALGVCCLAATNPAEAQSPAPSQASASTKPAMTTRVDAAAILAPEAKEGFHFVIYGDRTGGNAAGLKILEQAVVDTNLLDPDLVMTVGDLIQGYNTSDDWMPQMKEYKAIMKRLKMNWYPVAGNHDIYWNGRGRPQGHHESNYEKHFGPLWYAFEHKNCGFIVLYSDEGDPKTNRKGFNDFALQQMSEAQLAFLDKALKQYKSKDHVMVFLHHPRWIEKRYEGSNWPTVHKKLVAAGNVKACFAGHIHFLHYQGPKDGIEYFTLGATGGHIQGDIPDAGFLHHMNVVSVRKDKISVAAVPVGAVFDPKKFTPEFHAAVKQARSVAPVQTSPPLEIGADGSVAGEVVLEIKNSSPGTVRGTLVFDPQDAPGWGTTLEHAHVEIAKNSTRVMKFKIRRFSGADELGALPRMIFEPTYEAMSADGSTAAVKLAPVRVTIKMKLKDIPAGFFDDVQPHALSVQQDAATISIPNKEIDLHDGPMTLEAWVKPSGDSGHNAIIAKTQSSEYSLFFDEGVPQFDIHLGGRYRTAKGDVKLPTDRWTHLAGVFDGETVSLHVDGKRVASNQATGKRKMNGLPLVVGGDPDGAGRPTRCFHGLIDEVRLSKSAIYRENFEPTKTLSAGAETVLLLHLDKRVGPFAFDHSGNGKGHRTLLVGPSAELVPVER